MRSANHDDIIRLFPGLQDHAALEMLALRPTVRDLEVTMALLQDDDERVIESERYAEDRPNRLLDILMQSGYSDTDDIEE